MRCDECRFWDKISTLPDSGFCRRRSPRITGGMNQTLWPTTYNDDWCGKFQVMPTSPVPIESDPSWVDDPRSGLPTRKGG